MNLKHVEAFLNALGPADEPFGMYYSDVAPQEGVCPKPMALPSVLAEAEGKVDWATLNRDRSCVIGVIWRARIKKVPAFFDSERFGCLGGAFYLGYLKPQLETIVHYVSSGIPGRLEGEHYLESPKVTRDFFEKIDPRPAPARYCIFQPLSLFVEGSTPELVTFFARPEIISGLNQLATFVTNDFEAVSSPFGAGCANMVSWPLKYAAEGRLKAVLGGWDPSERKYLKTDELTFTTPYKMFDAMVQRWPESFLATTTWKSMVKRVEKSRRAWGE